MKSSSRQLNVELLRGILMLMICGLHVIGLNILDKSNPIQSTEYNFYISNFFESTFVMAVDCFVLISGYFGIRANIRKYLLFIIPIILYSFTITLLVSFVNRDISIYGIIKSIFPVLSNQYWFVSVYAVMFIISPLLNEVKENITKRQFESTLIMGLLFFVIIPSFSPFSLTNHNRGFGIINFCLLYLIGSYIRKYVKIDRIDKLKYLSCYAISVLIIFILNIIQGHYFTNHGWETHCNAYDNLFVYTAAISFFLFFTQIKLNWNIIGYLSPSFFYVYIIHENPNLRYKIYNLLRCSDYYESPYWIIHMLVSSIIIFFICLSIDLIRRKLTEKLTVKIADSLSTKIQDLVIAPIERFIQKN